MAAATVQIRQRGTLTLPAKLREKYRLDEGDTLTLVDLDEFILLTPRLPVVPKLAAEIERLRDTAGLEIEELFTARRSRRQKGTRPPKRP